MEWCALGPRKTRQVKTSNRRMQETVKIGVKIDELLTIHALLKYL